MCTKRSFSQTGANKGGICSEPPQNDKRAWGSKRYIKGSLKKKKMAYGTFSRARVPSLLSWRRVKDGIGVIGKCRVERAAECRREQVPRGFTQGRKGGREALSLIFDRKAGIKNA